MASLGAQVLSTCTFGGIHPCESVQPCSSCKVERLRGTGAVPVSNSEQPLRRSVHVRAGLFPRFLNRNNDNFMILFLSTLFWEKLNRLVVEPLLIGQDQGASKPGGEGPIL